MNKVTPFFAALVTMVLVYFLDADTETLIGCVLFFTVFFGAECSLKLDDIKNAIEKETR